MPKPIRSADPALPASGSGDGRMGAFMRWSRGLLVRIRDRSPLAAHALRVADRYLEVNGSLLSAGLTYYGFLALFPLLAVGLGVTALAAHWIPSLDTTFRAQLARILPSGIDLDSIARAGLAVGVVGLVVLLYAGVRWVGSLRRALYLIWGAQPREVAFGAGVVRDIATLALLGGCILGSISLTLAINLATGWLGDVLGFTGGFGLLPRVLGLALSLATDAAAFYLIFRWLPPPTVSRRALISGALLGAVGFEMLKQLATVVASGVSNNLVYGTFAVTVGLMVWIGYASRLLLLTGAWAATATPPPPTPPPPPPTPPPTPPRQVSLAP